jgi:hypothetical protein
MWQTDATGLQKCDLVLPSNLLSLRQLQWYLLINTTHNPVTIEQRCIQYCYCFCQRYSEPMGAFCILLYRIHLSNVFYLSKSSLYSLNDENWTNNNAKLYLVYSVITVVFGVRKSPNQISLTNSNVALQSSWKMSIHNLLFQWWPPMEISSPCQISVLTCRTEGRLHSVT